MKKFKTLLLLIMVSLLALNSILAQDRSLDREINIQKTYDLMNAAYHLTKEQEIQIIPFIEVYIDKQETIKKQKVSSYDELKKHYSKASRELHDTVKTMLTQKQLRHKDALFYYPRFKVDSYTPVCLITNSNSTMADLEKRNYNNNKKLPTLLTQRSKLAKLMKVKDVERMKILRKEWLEAEQEIALFKKYNAKALISAKGLSSMQRNQYSEIRDNRNEINSQIETLVTKYDEDINTLFEEIQPEMDKWKEDIKAIDNKYFPKRVERKMKWTAVKKAEVATNEMHRFKVAFILLDTDANNTFQNRMEVEERVWGGNNQLEIELKQAGTIKLELLEKEGEVVQTILSERFEAGFHVVNIDYLGIKKEKYIYSLTTAEGEVIQKEFFAYSERY